jgi:hypothetical protein
LERGYGKPISESEVERQVRREADEARRRKKKAARSATVEAASANLLKQWETMTPEERKDRLVRLQAESLHWDERTRWVETQLGGYDLDWLASGGVPKYEAP